jgi:glycosyltransferase involved in cell wall biosynthesis
MGDGNIIGIDASRNRSGGAKAHLIGILTSVNPAQHYIQKIHLWSFKSLLDSIPDYPWLIKHNPFQLERSLAKQLWWQAAHLSEEVREAHCDILFSTDASTLCRFKPMVVLSQDMLSYEPGVMRHFGFGYKRLRLLVILHLQNAAFRNAQGVIFLTSYAGRMIQKSCGPLHNVAFIPHGVGAAFAKISIKKLKTENKSRLIRCLYVSNVAPYKNQWHVVHAIKILRNRGLDVQLTLVGAGVSGGTSKAQKRLETEMNRSDPKRLFTKMIGHVSHQKLPQLLAKSNIFIFASSCENMPNTLVEAMAVGLPIACSDRGPMPEVLKDGGVYFEPEKPESIASAVEKIISNSELRMQISRRAKQISEEYSWERCANETFKFIANISHHAKL